MDEEIKNLLRTLLAVAIENRTEDAKKARKDEKILSESGLSVQDIALILGKSPAATAKAIQRLKRNK